MRFALAVVTLVAVTMTAQGQGFFGGVADGMAQRRALEAGPDAYWQYEHDRQVRDIMRHNRSLAERQKELERQNREMQEQLDRQKRRW